jgi:hypothetical protein
MDIFTKVAITLKMMEYRNRLEGYGSTDINYSSSQINNVAYRPVAKQ